MEAIGRIETVEIPRRRTLAAFHRCRETRRPSLPYRAAFLRGLFRLRGSRHPHDAQAFSQPATCDQRYKLHYRSWDGIVLRAERVRDSLQLRGYWSLSELPKSCKILHRALCTDLSALRSFSRTAACLIWRRFARDCIFSWNDAKLGLCLIRGRPLICAFECIHYLVYQHGMVFLLLVSGRRMAPCNDATSPDCGAPVGGLGIVRSHPGRVSLLARSGGQCLCPGCLGATWGRFLGMADSFIADWTAAAIFDRGRHRTYFHGQIWPTG